MAKHVGYQFARNDPRVNEQLDKLDGFDGRAERDTKMSREAWRAPEGVTLCDIELDAQGCALELAESRRGMRTPVIA
jgi:hypothetical protein